MASISLATCKMRHFDFKELSETGKQLRTMYLAFTFHYFQGSHSCININWSFHPCFFSLFQIACLKCCNYLEKETCRPTKTRGFRSLFFYSVVHNKITKEFGWLQSEVGEACELRLSTRKGWPSSSTSSCQYPLMPNLTPSKLTSTRFEWEISHQ